MENQSKNGKPPTVATVARRGPKVRKPGGKSVNLNLSPDVREMLAALATEHGISRSDAVEQAVREKVARRVPGQLKCG